CSPAAWSGSAPRPPSRASHALARSSGTGGRSSNSRCARPAWATPRPAPRRRSRGRPTAKAPQRRPPGGARPAEGRAPPTTARARAGPRVGGEKVSGRAGGKPAIFFPLLALLEEGDEAIYPNPGFPIYESMIEFSGAKAVPLALLEQNQFRTDVDELKRLITPKTNIVIINSPPNPSGSPLNPAHPPH